MASLDLTGSGAQTIAHLGDDGRITRMLGLLGAAADSSAPAWQRRVVLAGRAACHGLVGRFRAAAGPGRGGRGGGAHRRGLRGCGPAV